MKIETYLLDVIENQSAGPFLSFFLNVLSKFYKFAIHLRHFFYDRIFKGVKLDIPVISIGNIVAGGTGKTPFVEYLAHRLSSQKKIAILSRGYRRKGKKIHIIKEDSTAEECGDEPLQLAKKLPQTQVIVGANRTLSGKIAQNRGAELIVLDDGMQHRKLRRDIEICLMHAEDLFGKGEFLPKGLLRDSPKRLKNCDLIVINGVKDGAEFNELKNLITPYTSSPLVGMQLKVKNSIEIASKKVAAFCGIASPSRFYQTLRSLGCEIVLMEKKPDHIPFSKEELESLDNLAYNRGIECLVCTEKDKIKIETGLNLRLPLIPLEIQLEPVFGKEHLESLIQRLK